MFAAMAAFLVAALCVPEAFGDDGAAVRGAPTRSSAARTSSLFMHRQPRATPPCAARCSAWRSARRSASALIAARLVRRRAAAGRAVGARAGARRRRPVLLRRRGLEARARPLRRAPRADRHHRAGRVDRRDRRRRARRASTPASSRRRCSASSWPPRCGGCTSTSSRSSPSGGWRSAAPGRERNEIARDSFSYLHFPMVAGIVLLALGLKKTLGHVERPAEARARRRAARRRWRSTCSPTSRSAGATCTASARQRLRHRAGVLVALIPAARRARRRSSTLAIVAAVLVGLIVYETLRFAELRRRVRRELTEEPAA